MNLSASAWNPFESRSWADALGLVHVPMFGEHQPEPLPGQHAVLLDGRRGTFSLSVTEEREFALEREEPLSWSWSSDTRCLLVVDKKRQDLILRRWDAPEVVRRFHLPKNVVEARRILPIVESLSSERLAADVVTQLLVAFRMVRAALANDDAITAVKLFILLLLGAEAVNEERLEREQWLACRKMADLLELAKGFSDASEELRSVSGKVLLTDLGTLPELFVLPDRRTGCKLSPSLLLRHASGRLFQEAHLVLEREEQMQARFAGFDEGLPLPGTLGKDVRYTPTTLARALTEQAFDAFFVTEPARLSDGNAALSILDPACGSSIFLQEALRDLARRGYKGSVRLHGIDVTEISCIISRFCLGRAKRESPLLDANVAIEITSADALSAATSWGRPDLVLMNPPFINYLRLGLEEKKQVQEILTEVAGGQPDKAMAFVWKAATVLRPGCVLSTVIPSSLTENSAGLRWRQGLANRTELILVGRFRGYGYFVSSLVEPAFLILRAKPEPRLTSQHGATEGIHILLANKGNEDNALRGLRLGNENIVSPGEPSDYELYHIPADALTPGSWTPRSQIYLRVVKEFKAQGMPTVTRLFDVREGISAGLRGAFVLDASEWSELPKSERETFFRPVAGQHTIRNGRIVGGRYIFYPYELDAPATPLIASEDELRKRVPVYIERYLEEHRAELIAKKADWWNLRRRGSGTTVTIPKLVSTNFGAGGSFAYDEKGGLAMLQGHAWIWREQPLNDGVELNASDEDDEDKSFDFHASPLPWAYLAILNSFFFSELLAYVCPRVQGGQYELARKYLEAVHLPDLSSQSETDTRLLARAARIGRAIHADKEIDWNELDALTKQIYRLPANLDFAP